MGFEKDTLQFRTTKVDGIPEELEPTVQLLLHSQSIEAAIQSAQELSTGLSHGGFSYIQLFKSLQWLRDHRILKNPAISVFIDQNQSEYVWPKSLLKFPIAEVSVWRNARLLREALSIGFSPWVLVLPVGLLFLGGALGLLQGFIPAFKALDPATMNVITTLFALSCLRTLQALAVALIQNLLGLSVSLKWILSPISFHLEASDRGHPEAHPLLARFQIMIAALCPLALWLLSWRVADPQIFGSLVFATGLWIVTEFSPFAQSELTLALKDLFKTLGPQHLKGFQNLHKVLATLWICTLGIFLVLTLKDPVPQHIGTFLGSSADNINSFVILVFISFVIFAFVDEILQGTGALEASTTTQLRRIFKTQSAHDKIKNFSALVKDLRSFSNLPVIQFLPPEAQAHFHSTSRLIRLREGQRICRQGDNSRDLYILLEGSLKIFRRMSGLGNDYCARIHPTSVFGELAFFMGVPRTATVIAEEDALLLRIPHSSRIPSLDAETMKPIRNTIWALQAMSQNRTLSQLPAETLSLLLKNTSYQHFEPGSTIAMQGDLADSAFIIVEGEVLVSQNGTPIRTIRKGDLVGEIGLFNAGTVRTAMLQASTAVLALRIQRDDFRTILRADLGLAIRIERLMLSRLEADRARSTR